MTHDELVVKAFVQEDMVTVEFYNKTDKELVHNVIKENIIYKAKRQNYSPISEPVIEFHKYLKNSGGAFMPVFDKAEADLIVFYTTIKVVKEQSK